MSELPKLWQFQIIDIGSAVNALANKLVITEDGGLRFYAGRQLVGAIKPADWRRVVLVRVPAAEVPHESG
jgi:hypothetical protein